MSAGTARPAEYSPETPILEIVAGSVRFPGAPGLALQDVSISMQRSRKWAVVGESGSGKSTLMRALLGLLPLQAGAVRWFGRDLAGIPATELRSLRSRVQPVFQDPIASFDPRFCNRQILEEPLIIHGWKDEKKRLERCTGVLEQVGLDAGALDAHPRKMSGGQRQRLAIARAMTLSPEVLIADEPTAALDLSVQGQILSLLLDLHERTGLTLVFISHDLPLVSQLCDQVAVLYAGRLVECGPATEVFFRPLHPYTRDLLDASGGPLPDASSASLPGPSPSGCPYASRCTRREEACDNWSPMLHEAGPVRVACRRVPLDFSPDL
ncbi:ABC transporter ATP-binding protein [Myxococcota bacterium]|nr:ABC transporter ATP-binding protein [Myxococcota bacterium]MBU1412890.1 ABC transporter ATP-binding protein [Myxococcota bacterium]MBU1508761.1 ABC transporter ATP-binding protein [Myxococcota bacterium]PKN24207.1 MAG: peptide ABC transporter ATP-binding protein [Deltaproteobacteria bacterium HGW-Deltaproteobacteria-22]